MMAPKIKAWFESRYKIGPFSKLLTEKTVPLHRFSVFYFFGGMALFLFIIQVITGVLLLFYYKPYSEGAFESVKFIMTEVEFGWLIRSIHAWSANLMIFFAFAHLFSVLFLKSYRPPRELTWVSGVVLFFLVLGFGFTGYLLPWNELSFFATKVGTQMAGSIPVVGGFLRAVMRGGEEVGDATLTRFFCFHIIGLPIIAGMFLFAHLFMIQLQGMSEPLGAKEQKEKRVIQFFPNFLLRDVLAWLIAFGILVVLSFYFPAELGKKADPFAPTPAGIKPEWYFLFVFQTLKYIPGKVLFFEGEFFGLMLFGIAGVLLILVPFIDIWSRKEKPHWFFNLAGLLALIFIIIMTFISLAGAEPMKDSCVDCHSSLKKEITNDVHFKRGLSCVDCHGGDNATDDFVSAKDETKGFVGKPARNDIPNLCARCHSDASYMRRFNPNIPTDQLSKYNVSQHGTLNAAGDKKVAVCTSCHDAHGIRSKDDPLSPVYITNVPHTCGWCHSDKGYMKEYNIPTNQLDEFKQSVHGEALLVRHDRGAPACNSCHGSHDAALPRVIAVGNVCSQCHSMTRDLFAKSPHKSAHDALGIPECEVCHGNHKIMQPSDDMLGTGKGSLCINCHTPGSNGYLVATSMKSSIDALKQDIGDSEHIVLEAERLGMDVEDSKFNLDEAKHSLTRSRTYVHTFSKDAIRDITKEGATLAQEARQKAVKAIAEFNFRRKGFIISLVIIIILAISLYLKIKRMEKR